VVLQLPAPGVQEAGRTGEVGADAALVFGEPCAGRCGRLEHGVVREALMRAEKGTQGLGDGKGEEEVRTGQRSLHVVMKPLLGCMLLTRGTVPVATGMMDAVVLATAWARREAVALVPAWALLESADDLAVRGGEVGRTLQGLWRKGGEDLAEGGHGRSPCMRALRRS